MANKTKSAKGTIDSSTKKQLVSELDYFKSQTSGLTEYINHQEYEIKEAELALEGASTDNLSLQRVIRDQQEKYDKLADRAQSLENIYYIAKLGISIASTARKKQQDRIADLEQDLHHMTIQRDALKDRVKGLEKTQTVYVFEKLAS